MAKYLLQQGRGVWKERGSKQWKIFGPFDQCPRLNWVTEIRRHVHHQPWKRCKRLPEGRPLKFRNPVDSSWKEIGKLIRNCIAYQICLYVDVKVRKTSKVRKRYNKVPHLTQDTTWESNQNTINSTNKSQEVSPFPAGEHKAAMNRHENMRNTRHKNTNDPQKVPPWNGQWKYFTGFFRFWLKDLSIDEMVGTWCFGSCQAHRCLPVGFLLLRYSVLSTVESLSLLYLLFISWFICSRRWCIDKLGFCHAKQTSMCSNPHLN